MPRQPPERLDSWKEIADYLGRDVSTAIRWEKERGLPVHRVPGGKRQAVFAYTNEIEAWLRGGGAAGRSGLLSSRIESESSKAGLTKQVVRVGLVLAIWTLFAAMALC